MKYSKLFGRTRHNPPCDADSVNAKLLTQAGFVEKLAAGIYNFLPLGQRVLTKVCNIIREEMNAVEGQEILMPSLHPVDIWETTGRRKSMDEILYKTRASGDKEFVFGPSHEEVVTPLVAKYIQSYKDLPLSVYQIQTKFRDEPRAKSGLLRGREFGMKDMYSFHTDEADLDKYYETVKDAYFKVFERCGLKAYIIEASGGAFSDKFSHEFSVETPAGEDTIILCEKCGTAQNLEIAEGHVEGLEDEKELPMEEIKIERDFSIAKSAKLYGIPEAKILKTVVYEVEDGGLIGIVIRGDLNVSDVKLERYLKRRLRPATPEALKNAGLVQGFISPVNMSEEIGISFIADNSVKSVKNFVTGANKVGYDYKNVNVGTDFTVKEFVDLVEVKTGFKCPKCHEHLSEIKAVEGGNIFKLGTKFANAFGMNFADNDGKLKPVVMGCYGIGTTRLVGTIVEARHDEKGIIWPKSVAPYLVHLISLGNDESVIKDAEKLYEKLNKEGVEVLFDDRDAGAGVKLNDADLIGLPLRIVISKRTLESKGVEWKERTNAESEIVAIADLVKKIKEFQK